MKKSIIYSFLFLAIISLSSFGVHKFYVSIYQINYNQKKQMLEITSRIFIDDLNEIFAEQEEQLSHQYDTGKPTSDMEIIERHLDLKNRMNSERETYARLKKEVFDFLGDNL